MYEKEIKYKVFKHLLDTEEENSVFINEFGVNWASARADIAVINGFIHLIEIKSSHDSLGRLEQQIKLFLPYAEKTTVVVADKHYKKVVRKAPFFAGIYVMNGDDLEVDREPIVRQISPQALAELWWSEELKILLGGVVRGANRLCVEALRRHLVRLLPYDVLLEWTKENLKHRYYERSKKIVDAVINNKPFPYRKLIHVNKDFIVRLKQQLPQYSG